MTKTKPSRQEMIDSIYDKIARKDLSFGCRIIYNQDSNLQNNSEGIISSKDKSKRYMVSTPYYNEHVWEEDIQKTIGHPVMIGDVMDYFEKNNFTKFKRILGIMGNDVNFDQSLAMLWLEKRKPIEDQSDECIDFVYNLISK